MVQVSSQQFSIVIVLQFLKHVFKKAPQHFLKIHESKIMNEKIPRQQSSLLLFTITFPVQFFGGLFKKWYWQSPYIFHFSLSGKLSCFHRCTPEDIKKDLFCVALHLLLISFCKKHVCGIVKAIIRGFFKEITWIFHSAWEFLWKMFVNIEKDSLQVYYCSVMKVKSQNFLIPDSHFTTQINQSP